jgi:hypothetical protein
MEKLVLDLSQFGITGAVLAVLIYDVFFLQKKLLDIVDRNTAAFVELKSIIEKRQSVNT